MIFQDNLTNAIKTAAPSLSDYKKIEFMGTGTKLKINDTGEVVNGTTALAVVSGGLLTKKLQVPLGQTTWVHNSDVEVELAVVNNVKVLNFTGHVQLTGCQETATNGSRTQITYPQATEAELEALAKELGFQSWDAYEESVAKSQE